MRAISLGGLRTAARPGLASVWLLISRGLAALGLFLLVLQFSGIDVAEGISPTARVIVNLDRRIYVSPPCIETSPNPGDWFAWPMMSITEARSEGYAADRDCIEKGGFAGANWGLVREIMIVVGILHRPSRWTAAGDWNW